MNAISQVMPINRALSAEVNAVIQQDQPKCTYIMAIDIQVRDYLARIAMSGRFDFQTWRNFTTSYAPLLDNPVVREIWVDMTRVDYLDSSAMGMLLLLNERAKANNKRVALHITSNFVLRAFDFARFSKIFNIKHCPSESSGRFDPLIT